MKRIIYILTLVSILASCSTTSGLLDDEVLYTGIKSTDIEGKKGTYEESVALTEVEAALAYAPNNSFMGSSSVRTPLPIGLWIYNGLVNKQKSGLSKWMFDTFATQPVTLTAVNPKTRVQVASNTLQNYGYFQGKVDYEIVPQKNPKKAKINYTINLGEPYLIDSIEYMFPALEDSIIRSSMSDTFLKKGGQFSVADLQAEKDRITNVLRNKGYYYYRPDYINYLADSVAVPQKVRLRVIQDQDTPERAKHQWYIGNVTVGIKGSDAQRASGARGGNQWKDSLTIAPRISQRTSRRMGGALYRWTGEERPIDEKVLMRNLRFFHGQLYSQDRVQESLTNLTNMQMFRNIQFTYTPRDTTDQCDTVDVIADMTMDKLIDAEFEFNITQKSNSQVGPNAALILSKRNALGHGETLSMKLKGSYEWQTKSSQHSSDADQINSYEAGLETSLSYPWLVFPGLNTRRFRYASQTEFKFDIDHLNRSGYYRLLSFNVEADYTFQTSKSWSHRFTPLALTYNRLEHTTARFDSIALKNPALLSSLQNQFIPAMQYAITYDNSWNQHLRNTTWLELSVKESGNLTSLGMMLAGKQWDEQGKNLFNCPYSQFLKVSADLRNTFPLTDRSLIATRLYAGVLWSFGNSSIAPYSELFYVGGANDIRAFAAHGIGPGGYYDYEGRGTYLDQAADFKLEANIEYRFPIVSNLYGALFLDAGNVWLLNKQDSHPNGDVELSSILDRTALGTGFGFRYDLEFLILRLDVGVGIHAPYDTGKSGYYNIQKFWKDGVGLHFAVGYPF